MAPHAQRENENQNQNQNQNQNIVHAERLVLHLARALLLDAAAVAPAAMLPDPARRVLRG